MGKSQKGCYKKRKHNKFSEKQTFLTPWYAGKKCSFFGKFSVLSFLVTPALTFALLLYYPRTLFWTTADVQPHPRNIEHSLEHSFVIYYGAITQRTFRVIPVWRRARVVIYDVRWKDYILYCYILFIFFVYIVYIVILYILYIYCIYC